MTRTDERWVGKFEFGTRIKKCFNDKYYKGKTCAYNPFLAYYTIKYDDGDEEELTKEEVEEHRIEHTTDKRGTTCNNGKSDIEAINILTRRIVHRIYCILTNHCFC